MKRGLVLDGGGAKGGYQIGVWKYLREKNIKFDVISGASVGGLNAVLIQQGDFDKAVEVWSSLELNQVMEFNQKGLVEFIWKVVKEISKLIVIRRISPGLQKKLVKRVLMVLAGKGSFEIPALLVNNGIFDSTPLISLTDKSIDYKNLPSNPKVYLTITQVDFSLISSSDNYAPFNDANWKMKRQLLIGTSALPLIFPKMKYLDGAIVDNNPVKPCLDEDCDQIISIHLSPNYKSTLKEAPPSEIIDIVPSEDLGGLISFSGEKSSRHIDLGYSDAKKQLEILAV